MGELTLDDVVIVNFAGNNLSLRKKCQVKLAAMAQES